jgi:hypothetical protein
MFPRSPRSRPHTTLRRRPPARRGWPRLRLHRLEDRTVPAQIVWDGGPTGTGTNWLDRANWAGDRLPGPADDAVLGGGAVAVLTDTATTVRSATIAAGATFRLAGATLQFADSITNAGTIELSRSATRTSHLDGSPYSGTPGTVTNAVGGTIITSGRFTSIGAALDNQGTLTVGPQASVILAYSGVTTNSGAIMVADGGAFSTQMPVNFLRAFVNTGTITLATASSKFQCDNFRYQSGAVTGAGSVVLLGTIVGSGTTFDADYTVAVGDLTLHGAVNGPGTLTNPAGHTLKLMGPKTVTAPLVNQGTLVSDWFETVVNGPFSNATGATLRVESALTVPGGFTNHGAIELTSDSLNLPATLAVDTGPLVNAPGGSITVLPGGGGAPTVSGRIENQGTITIGIATTWVNPGASSNAGTVAVTGGDLTLDQSAPGAAFASTGTVTVAAGRTLTVPGGLANGGTLTGAGTVAGGVAGPGTVSPGGLVPGVLTIAGGFAGTGPLAVDLNGTAPGTQYDQLKVTGAVSLGWQLAVTPGFAPALGDTFVILDNDGTDPVAGTFAGLPERATLTAGGQTFVISYAGGTGNDVTLTAVPPVLPTPPRVGAVRANDGTAQRSRVAALAVAFNTPVSFAAAPAGAFALTRDSDGAAVTFTATVSAAGSVVTLSNFTGPATEFGSLADGTYTLTVRASQVSTPAGPLDGNGDGTGGDDYTFGAAQGLVRLFGDMNGDRAVAGADVDAFVAAFGAGAGRPAYRAELDFDGNGLVNGTDFNQFRARFAASQARPQVAGMAVNTGSAQRSMVTALAVTFDTIVTFAGPAAAAFILTRTSDGAAVAFTATVALTTGGRTVVTLADFAGAAAQFGSLADGNYTLTVRASQVSTPAGPLDGNGDGTGGDDYTAGLYRLYGDTTGDRAVGPADLDAFKAAYGARAGTAAYRADLDVNADGYLNGTDFNQFRTRYGVALPP